MADSISRTIRDGALEGEHAPSLTIKDTTASPYGFDVFTHVLSQASSLILAGKSQSRGLVVVAYSRSPSFYLDFLKRSGVDVASSQKWIHILDCYTDPLGWKHQLADSGILPSNSSAGACLFQDVKDINKLQSLILELGSGLVGQGKVRFSVAIDSVMFQFFVFQESRYWLSLLMSILGTVVFVSFCLDFFMDFARVEYGSK
ncbi:unnamed protein product [Linum tenue]|uniref:Elongator complex protein 5 n=1 Tax=Linum tenue TaxID=586396 RepID=A0AAV0N9A5_9ROSI|nr:unnamed protein product [Linum tenue]